MKGRELLRARKSESRRTRQRQRGRGGSEFVRKGDEVQRRKEMERGWRVAGGDKRDGKCRRMFIS